MGTQTVLWIFLINVLIHSTVSQNPEYDMNQRNHGQKSGELTSAAVAGIAVGVIAGMIGLATTVFFCYYVYKKQQASVDHTNSFEIKRY
ncbi:uncharacterized protein [Centruroides vittatus]|uniref:uncharacterized protein n=1 Tax=Centruroides vittatus TaxID=120091 RepID=UPI0035106028